MLFLGNLASLVGCALMVAIGFVRQKDRVIRLQCLQFGFLAAGNLLLGAVSGFISGVVSILRNLIFPRVKGGLGLKLLFIGVQLALTLMAGWDGLISLLPLFSGILFTWYIDTKSDVQLKAVIIAAQIMWAVYDIYYRNYVAFTFDILTVLSNLAGIAMLKKAEVS